LIFLQYPIAPFWCSVGHHPQAKARDF